MKPSDNLRLPIVIVGMLLILVIGVVSCTPNNFTRYLSPTPVDDGAILVSPDGAAPFSGPNWHPDGSKLVVETEYNFAITIDLSSSTVTELQGAGFTNKHISWSPSGNQIAFWTQSLGDTGIWVLDLSNANNSAQFISKGINVGWAPSGLDLVIGATGTNVDSPQPTNAELFIININNGSKTSLFKTTKFYPGIYPAWSPDGRYIVFVLSYLLSEDIGTEGITELYVVDLQENQVKLLIEGPIYGQSLNWSPDSSMFMYVYEFHQGMTSFRVVDLQGNCHQIDAAFDILFNPKLSPDGTKIAFEGPGGGIYVADAYDRLGDDYWNVGSPCR